MANNQLAINSLRVLEEHEIRITNLEQIAREQAELGVRIAKLELKLISKKNQVQGAQHRLHNTGWYKDVKKLEDIVNRDRLKRCMCQDNGIFLLE
ncbi:13264_t:CDS:2, partial [Ambispora gerdemannii]